MRFVTGARLLSGDPEPATGRAGLFRPSPAPSIRAAYDQVRAAFEAEHGRVPGGRVAVLGLGRLGSRELTADSDLDLVVLYDFDEANRESDGPRSLDAVVYYTRLTQRLVAALTAPTRRGRLYEVDLRLRPAGRQGPRRLAVSRLRRLPAQRGRALGAHGADPRPRARRRPVPPRRGVGRHRRDRLRAARSGRRSPARSARCAS